MNPTSTRATLLVSVAAALVAAASSTARAERKPDGPIAGTFQARFELVSSNCKDTGMSLRDAAVELGEAGGGKVAVSIPMVPPMKGVVSRGGKFKAEARRGRTAVAGVEGRFSVAGRVEGQNAQFLFIAEYYKDGKALCTQSWNGTGPRK